MAAPKNYFHNRTILLLLSINAFLAIAHALYLLLQLDYSGDTTYAVEYRSRLGLNAFSSGTANDIAAFAVLSLFVFAFHFYLSRKTYHVKQHFAITVLGLGTLLLTLSIIVSNTLLQH